MRALNDSYSVAFGNDLNFIIVLCLLSSYRLCTVHLFLFNFALFYELGLTILWYFVYIVLILLF